MKLLVMRLSALGDVAMTIPVITSLARQYPQLEITLMSKPFIKPLFVGMPPNFHFREIDIKEYRGLLGLIRLFRELKDENYDIIADLHDVLRTKILRFLFRVTGKRVFYIDKGRKEKRALTRKNNKILKQLPSSFSRYENVFLLLGYPVKTTFHSIYGEGKGETNLFAPVIGIPDSKKWIGLAPFAAHRGKRLPEEITKALLLELSKFSNWRIFLFGGGGEERKLLEDWARLYDNIESVAGKFKLNEELALMSHLSTMISMDSANMHLASLTGVPVISIWGATHPFAGFMGWGQTTANAIQIELACRPCSIFGNKPCLLKRGQYACLNHTPYNIVSTVAKVVNTPE
jgi:ADP-heptose:LPS heptosyltransferase